LRHHGAGAAGRDDRLFDNSLTIVAVQRADRSIFQAKQDLALERSFEHVRFLNPAQTSRV
jgi:hypothetical protein